jgi:hypothetical protein
MGSFDESLVERAMQAGQYVRVSEYVYRAAWSTSEVEHFVYIDIVNRRKEYLSGRFGMRNPEAEVFSISCLRKYGSELLRKHVRHNAKIDCTMNYDFAHLYTPLRPWRISTSSPSEISARLSELVTTRLWSVVHGVTRLPELFQLLVSDRAPFIWSPVNGALRAAQIVRIGIQLGNRPSELISSLKSKLDPIRLGLGQGAPESAESYVRRLICEVDTCNSDN